MKLTYQQKLDALAYRFYQCAEWTPKAGDHYTTSRADLQLYQVVAVEDGMVRTRYTEGSDAVSEWPAVEFLTGGFGPKRVFVPPWVMTAKSAQVWKPIETAPKDKTPVIVAVPNKEYDDYTVGEAYFDPESAFGLEEGEWWWAGTSGSDHFDNPISETNWHTPEFWQPLPAPPSRNDNGGDA